MRGIVCRLFLRLTYTHGPLRSAHLHNYIYTPIFYASFYGYLVGWPAVMWMLFFHFVATDSLFFNSPHFSASFYSVRISFKVSANIKCQNSRVRIACKRYSNAETESEDSKIIAFIFISVVIVGVFHCGRTQASHSPQFSFYFSSQPFRSR